MKWYHYLFFGWVILGTLFVIYLMDEYARKGTLLGSKVDLQKEGGFS